MLIMELKQKYKFAGLIGALKHLGYFLANKIMYFDCLRTMTLSLSDVDSKYLETPSNGMIIKFLDKEEVLSFAKNPEYDLTPDFLKLALKNEDKCMAILDGDVLASYGWYSTEPSVVTGEFKLNFTEDWVYMHRGYTNHNYRGKRLHAIGMAHATKAFTEEGFLGLTSIVASNNASSLKSVIRLGYRLTGRIYLFAKLNHYFVVHSLGAKYAEMWLTPFKRTTLAHLFNRPYIAKNSQICFEESLSADDSLIPKNQI